MVTCETKRSQPSHVHSLSPGAWTSAASLLRLQTGLSLSPSLPLLALGKPCRRQS